MTYGPETGGKPTILGAATLLLLGATSVALGQSGEDVTVDLGNCVDLESAAERFACYEAQVNAVLEARDAAETASRDAAAARPAAPATAVPAPPRQVSQPPAVIPDPPQQPAPEPVALETESDEVFATIAELREIEPNSYLITMEDGQVWRQVRPKWYPLRPGLEVRIYPTRWGPSMRMTAVDVNGFIQVRKIR